MGGVWTPPLKLLDGIWLGVDGKWIGPATKFTSGWGYTRYDLPDTAGLKLQRTDFVPDGVRGANFSLRITNPGSSDREVRVMVDAHSELMGAYPWGSKGVAPHAADDLPDHGSLYGRYLQFTDDGALPGAPVHHYAAVVGADGYTLASHSVAGTGGAFRGDRQQDLRGDRQHLAAEHVRRRAVREGHRWPARLQRASPGRRDPDVHGERGRLGGRRR